MSPIRGTVRCSGVDLAKIVAMWLVVLCHVTGLGLDVTNVSDYAKNTMSAISSCCIDIFALATGFLCVKARWRPRRFGELWLAAVFWGVVMLAVSHFAFGVRVGEAVVDAVMPVTRYSYWYFTSYAMLFAFIPFLNKALLASSRNELRIVLLAIVGLVCVTSLYEGDIMYVGHGYSFAWLAFVYLFGAYIRLFDPCKWRPAICFIAALAVSFVAAGLSVIADRTGFHTPGVPVRMMISYVSPLTFAQAILIFIGCKNVTVKSDRIASALKILSGATFGVYLIHVRPVFFRQVWPELLKKIPIAGDVDFAVTAMWLSAILFAGMLFCEMLRIKGFSWVGNGLRRGTL